MTNLISDVACLSEEVVQDRFSCMNANYYSQFEARDQFHYSQNMHPVCSRLIPPLSAVYTHWHFQLSIKAGTHVLVFRIDAIENS